MGYHANHIDKGLPGEISKIREELEELIDADTQGVKLMALLELSDMIGAISLYLRRYHPTLTVQDLIKMAERTESAFKDGSRR